MIRTVYAGEICGEQVSHRRLIVEAESVADVALLADLCQTVGASTGTRPGAPFPWTVAEKLECLREISDCTISANEAGRWTCVLKSDFKTKNELSSIIGLARTKETAIEDAWREATRPEGYVVGPGVRNERDAHRWSGTHWRRVDERLPWPKRIRRVRVTWQDVTIFLMSGAAGFSTAALYIVYDELKSEKRRRVQLLKEQLKDLDRFKAISDKYAEEFRKLLTFIAESDRAKFSPPDAFKWPESGPEDLN